MLTIAMRSQELGCTGSGRLISRALGLSNYDIPGRKNRKFPIPYDTVLYKQRNRIERMFGRLKDWCRIATR